MADEKRPSAATPGWAVLLGGLGWLIIVMTMIPTGVLVAKTLTHLGTADFVVVVPLEIALASAGYFLGGMAITIARSARRGVPSSRWRLWAKVLLHVGGMLSISAPCALYGTLPAGLQVMRGDPTGLSPVDPELLQMTLIVAGPFFVVGLAFVVPALIWGRRPPVPDLPNVFS